MTDAGPACDLVDRHVRADLGVSVGSRLGDAVAVALCAGAGMQPPRVDAERAAASSSTDSSDAACDSMRATSRLRRSASITISAAIIRAAAPAKAQ